MSKFSRDKGRRRELQILIRAERVPLSGASKYQGNGADIDCYISNRAAPLVCEVKARANGEGFKTLETWLGENDALFLIRDRAEPLAVLPWRVLVELVTR
jgi:hypothetical protein